MKKRFKVVPTNPKKEGLAFVFSVTADSVEKLETFLRGTFDDCCRRWRVPEVLVEDYDRPEEKFRYRRNQTRKAYVAEGQEELPL